MIGYVNSRCVLWSEWELKREASALGFPRECPYTRLVARAGGSGYQPDIDGDAMEVATALSKIKLHHPKIYRAIHLFYGIEFKNGHAVAVMLTKEMIAKDLECHRDTVYSYLDRGHVMLLDTFHENDVIAHRR